MVMKADVFPTWPYRPPATREYLFQLRVKLMRQMQNLGFNPTVEQVYATFATLAEGVPVMQIEDELNDLARVHAFTQFVMGGTHA